MNCTRASTGVRSGAPVNMLLHGQDSLSTPTGARQLDEERILNEESAKWLEERSKQKGETPIRSCEDTGVRE